MRRIIDGKRYNTETATELGYWTTGGSVNDFGYFDETLYRTPRGSLFLHGEGGARSPYSGRSGNMWHWGQEIRVLTVAEAVEWCEERRRTATLEQHFADRFVDA